MSTDFQPPLTRAGEPCKLCSKFGKPCRPEHAARLNGGIATADKAADITPQPRVNLDEPCDRCGTHHRGPEWEPKPGKCNGVKRDHSGLCGCVAGQRTPHTGEGRCWLHGGLTPSHVKLAQRKQAEGIVSMYGLSRKVGPHEAVEEELAAAAGHVDWLRELVNSHGPGDTPFNVPWAVWLERYDAEREYKVEFAATAIRAGIEERKVKVIEQQAQLYFAAFRLALEARGVELTDDWRAAMREGFFRAAERAEVEVPALEGEVVVGGGEG